MQSVTLHIKRLDAKFYRKMPVIAGASLLLLVMLFLLYRYRQYLKSPEYVLNRALHDLEIGDINDLYAISAKDTCSYLHITPKNAHLILAQTLWKHGFLQEPTYSPFGPVPDGVKQWVVTWRHPHFQVRQDMTLFVLERPDHRWYFDLPNLLIEACRMSAKPYNILAAQAGIRGSEYANMYWDIKGHFLGMGAIPSKKSIIVP
ncbi:MAG TPA: hypothetical protein VKV18_01225 [Chthonomonas sp.]|uniref:hypothetical protein n=1 Tax=Chthonomonas sp. TaxID=2282153 RepID=UPI002B4B2137|nr:hypothetical protein [Chthonomonas sp.]HLI47301.1 hypothetical protein [Chthonomonas sp.]